MHVNSVLSGFVGSSSKYHDLEKHDGCHCPSWADAHPGLGEDTPENTCGDNGTIEHERELEGDSSEEPSSSSVVDQHDFFDYIDLNEKARPEPEEARSCACNFGPVQFCPLCDHPDLKRGEICLCNLLVVDFHRARLTTKRRATAYSDAGEPLSREYCALIVRRSEVRFVLKRFLLPQTLIERGH